MFLGRLSLSAHFAHISRSLSELDLIKSICTQHHVAHSKAVDRRRREYEECAPSSHKNLRSANLNIRSVHKIRWKSWENIQQTSLSIFFEYILLYFFAKLLTLNFLASFNWA